jgi:hypothetical protein
VDKNKLIQLRCSKDEFEGIREAAKFSGVKFSPWCRDRLRSAAVAELERFGVRAKFLPPVPVERAIEEPEEVEEKIRIPKQKGPLPPAIAAWGPTEEQKP